MVALIEATLILHEAAGKTIFDNSELRDRIPAYKEQAAQIQANILKSMMHGYNAGW